MDGQQIWLVNCLNGHKKVFYHRSRTVLGKLASPKGAAVVWEVVPWQHVVRRGGHQVWAALPSAAVVSLAASGCWRGSTGAHRSALPLPSRRLPPLSCWSGQHSGTVQQPDPGKRSQQSADVKATKSMTRIIIPFPVLLHFVFPFLCPDPHSYNACGVFMKYQLFLYLRNCCLNKRLEKLCVCIFRSCSFIPVYFNTFLRTAKKWTFFSETREFNLNWLQYFKYLTKS